MFPWTKGLNKFSKKLIHFGFPSVSRLLIGKEFRIFHADGYIVLDAPETEVILEWLSANRPKAQTAVWLWNYYNPEELDKFKLLAKRFTSVPFYTFDKKNQVEGLIGYLDQFYLPLLKKYSTGEDFDLFFIGKNKGRAPIIHDIEEKCSSFATNNRICIFNDKVKNKNDEVTYEENLRLASKSRVMLDITSNSQSGLTLRVLEALYFRKKLITNNSDVRNHPFYTPENILIYDTRTPPTEAVLRQYVVNTPFKPVDPAMLELYSLENWLDKIFSPVPGAQTSLHRK
jgi:hypothetical protein